MICKVLNNFSTTPHKIGFGISLLVFLPVLFCLFCLNTNNAFADSSDVVFHVNPSTYTYICGYPSPNSCSDFSYIILSPSTDLNASYYLFTFGGVTLRLPNFSDSILAITSDISVLSINPGAISFTIILTNSLPGSSVPSGILPITSNGQFDVTQYAFVDVDVPAEVIQGDYHDDLVSIKHAIITCGGVILVLYFFYCIYRMIIKSTGGF